MPGDAAGACVKERSERRWRRRGACGEVAAQGGGAAVQRALAWTFGRLTELSQLSNFVHRFTNQGQRPWPVSAADTQAVTGLLQNVETTNFHSGQTGEEKRTVCCLAFSRLGHTAALHISTCCVLPRGSGAAAVLNDKNLHGKGKRKDAGSLCTSL